MLANVAREWLGAQMGNVTAIILMVVVFLCLLGLTMVGQAINRLMWERKLRRECEADG